MTMMIEIIGLLVSSIILLRLSLYWQVSLFVKVQVERKWIKDRSDFSPENSTYIMLLRDLQYLSQIKPPSHNNYTMCFLKHIKSQPLSQGKPGPSHPLEKTDSDTEIQLENEFISQPIKSVEWASKFDKNYFLLSCLNLMNFNSQLLLNLDEKLEQNGQVLDQTHHLLQTQTSLSAPKFAQKMTQIQQNIPQKVEQTIHATKDPLTPKLFGNHQYRYRLELAADFAETLYKERNFGFGVKLIDIASGKQMRNGNLINICLSVCDSNGEWIHETKEGIAFIKGKVESQLYHGEGEFIKLSPKDVSRGFPGKTINLVVYPKPTLLKYSGESSLEENIDYELIEPLVVRDVSVKAKKRE